MSRGTDQSKARPIIVCVDDDPAQLLAYEAFLGSALAAEVLAKDDAQAAIKELVGRPVDLIVLDVMMPGMDGFQLARHIRQHMPHQDRAPILFVTALDGLSNVQMAMRSGGDDFVTKPVGSDALIGKVRALLSVSGIADPLRRNQQYLKLIHTAADDDEPDDPNADGTDTGDDNPTSSSSGSLRGQHASSE